MCFVAGLVDGDAAEVQTGGGAELSVARGGVCQFDRQFKILSSAHKTLMSEFLYNTFQLQLYGI